MLGLLDTGSTELMTFVLLLVTGMSTLFVISN